MNKTTCVMTSLALLFSAAAYAQVPAKPFLSNQARILLRGGANKAGYFELGNMRLKLPPAVMKAHGADLMLSHLSLQLDPNVYPSYGPKNDARILRSIQRFIDDYGTFHIKAPEIAANIASRVIKGRVPYHAYLPQNAQNLYLGEVHNVPGLAAEIENLVRALPEAYPGRKIYLATEFLPAFENIPFSVENAVTDPREIAQLLEGTPRASTRVLNAALEAGIPVIGLEPETAILQEIVRETSSYPTPEMYEEFATSFEGMRFRNRAWSKYLRALRAAEPDALIVVYAGFGHVGYSEDFNLSSLLGGRSFVVLFTTPEFLPLNNPLFRYLRETPDIRGQFRSSPDAKLVEKWKKDTGLKKIMGTDMTVILHAR